ncbi:hypothetical protein F4805DRAFT_411482 [Annulohypoxylon moriforme]|nr:hypothetical protein F4805DRAFT_411482 [Annulohypoxylon moriforme]
MESLRLQGRQFFFRNIDSEPTAECNVHEISGSRDDILRSEKPFATKDVQDYLRADAVQPMFRLIQLKVAVQHAPHEDRCLDLAWVLDMLTELGIEVIRLSSFINGMTEFNVEERDLGEEGKVLNMVGSLSELGIAASFNPVTRSTICFFFERDTRPGRVQSKEMFDSMEQNESLYRNMHFLPLVFMNMSMNRIANHLPSYSHRNYDVIDVDNLLVWEDARYELRVAQQELLLVEDIARYFQEHLAASAAKEDPDTPLQGIADDYSEIKEASELIESRISPTQRHIEKELQKNDDYLAYISRGLMREDTKSSIKLAKSGVRLTRAARIDSSSMKVIAVMTMVFLPGTFFATLFAVPSLNWNGGDVVGKNFWMYWAFTIPFTGLVIALWLAITQRKQMRSVFDNIKIYWLIKVDDLKSRLRSKKKETREGEEEESEEESEEV